GRAARRGLRQPDSLRRSGHGPPGPRAGGARLRGREGRGRRDEHPHRRGQDLYGGQGRRHRHRRRAGRARPAAGWGDGHPHLARGSEDGRHDPGESAVEAPKLVRKVVRSDFASNNQTVAVLTRTGWRPRPRGRLAVRARGRHAGFVYQMGGFMRPLVQAWLLFVGTLLLAGMMAFDPLEPTPWGLPADVEQLRAVWAAMEARCRA